MSHFKELERKLSPAWFDITDYGAAGNGLVDDSRAITAAISAAHEAGGGVVFFPKGTYKCMAVKPQSQVTLRGEGWGKSVLQGFNDQSDNGIIDGTGYFSESSPLTEFNMYDLELDGSNMNRQGYSFGRKGIGNQWIKSSLFENIYVHDVPATGIGTDFTINVYFTNCLCQRCGTPGETGNGVGSNGFGIGVNEKTEAVEFTDCQALEIANNGFTLEAQSTQGVGYATIANCYTEKCGNAGYSNSGSQRVDVDGCTDNGSKMGVYVSANAGKSADQTIISNCEFKGQRSHGVYSDQAENNQLEVKGCMFSECRGAGIKTFGSYCSFSDNTFKGCREEAILCRPGAGAIGKGYLIADNLIVNGTSAGVQIDSTDQPITGLLVKGNLIQDCRDAAIRIICRKEVASGNIVGALVDGNVCVGNLKPQIQVVNTSNGLVIANNVESINTL